MKKYIFSSTLLALAIFMYSCTKKTDTVVQAPITNLETFKVRTAPVSAGSDKIIINATGILSSDLESKPAFKTGGVIEKTYFKEGDRVQQGALLATLNMSEIKAQVDQAKKVVEKSARDLARVKNLFADSVATLEQLQNVQTAYDMSLENVKIAEFNQSYSKVIAPASGIVMKQIMREGEIVGPGMPICVIMGIGQNHWVIKAAVSDKEWAFVRKGDKAIVKFEALPGQSFEGTVDKVADMANAGTATLDIEIKLKQLSQKLAAGLISNVIITPSQNQTKQKTSKTTIPIEALVSSHDGEGVIFVPKNGKAVKTKIIIDKIEGTALYVTAGLEGITEVITAGAVYLQDGNNIEIVK